MAERAARHFVDVGRKIVCIGRNYRSAARHRATPRSRADAP